MYFFYAFFTPICFVIVLVAAVFLLFGFSVKTSFVISFVWLLSAVLVALPVCAHLRRRNNSLPPIYRIVYKK